ncbi:MAG: hypothetical protein IJ060_11505 [Oscillospiraceae bacterium]|nr:hypothetical protein [Oscillospiraceae bacterium]
MSKWLFRRREKPGATAIPFLVTVLISIFIFGGVALYFYNKLMAKDTELQPMQSSVTRISDADINTILFILDPSDPDHPERETAMMLLHFDPVRKQEFCIGIPLDLQVPYEGKLMTAENCLLNHGLDAVKKAIGSALDQEVDRYIMMDSQGFDQLANVIGNVSYPSPIKDAGLRRVDDGVSVQLDNKQFETLLTSTRYDKETDRCTTIGLAVSRLLNQCDGTRIGNNLDNYFNTVINAVTTDITAMDFSDHKHAISYVFLYAQTPARAVSLICDEENGMLVVRPSFINDLKVTFYQVAAPSSAVGDDSAAAPDNTAAP